MKHILSSASLVLAVWALSCTAALAQPGSGGPAPGAVVTPIDGGASLLLASGIGYAVRRLRQRRPKA